jgi:hypothetical protein
MSTAKVCGYGVKVTAEDEAMDVKAIAALFKEHDKEEYLDSFFEEFPEITDFSFLAFSFMEMLEHSSDFEFVFIGDRDENAFVIIASRTIAKVYEEDVKAPGSSVDLYDSLTTKNFLSDFLPGYTADWICEEISPEWADLVDFTDEYADDCKNL